MMEYNRMQLLKREMFAMRNGIIADTLRRAGSKFSIIFGLNLPQIAEIASHFPPDKDFAEQVYANTPTRESMLIAPMLMPRDQFTADDAQRWISQAPENEVIDVLCLKLLRHQPYALELVDKLAKSPEEKLHYAALRLMCNLAPQHMPQAIALGEKEAALQNPKTLPLANILLSYKEC